MEKKTKPTKPSAPPEGKALLDDIFLNEGGQALEAMSRRCEEEFGRKPSLLDFKNLLEVLLGGDLDRYFADCETVELVEVAFKTKRKPKAQRYQDGDVFAIPLGTDLYAFGRILRDEERFGMLIEVFRETSKSKTYRPSIIGSGRLFYPVIVNDLECLKPWRWTVIHSDSAYRLSEADARLEFAAGHHPRLGFTVSNPFDARPKYRPIPEGEWRAMQSEGHVAPEDVERRIREAMKQPAP